MRRSAAWLLCAVGVVVAGGCGGPGDGADADAEAVEEVTLGPVDGFDLPATDTGRVAVGDMAPDFTAMSLAGMPVTLSQFRGQKNVVLMFYRGHW